MSRLTSVTFGGTGITDHCFFHSTLNSGKNIREFEPVWNECVEALNYSCKSLSEKYNSDLRANLLSEVCHDVCVEPVLQPLPKETCHLLQLIEMILPN